MAGHSRSLLEFTGFVLPEEPNRNRNPQIPAEPYIILEQRRIIAALQTRPARDFTFNNDQQTAFDAVCRSLEGPPNSTKLHFIDGPGGTGKTYLFNALLEHVRRRGDIALAVATSGTAALLLDGGRTAHSTFKIPLDVHSTTSCSFTPRSHARCLLKLASLIIWDEASMISRDIVDCVNRSMQDLMKSTDPSLDNVPFGGKLVVFGGDFRQVLPVIPNASRAQIIAQSFPRSSCVWPHVQVHRLQTNMRVQQARSTHDAAALQEFSNYLLRIGSGCEPIAEGTEDKIRVPDAMVLPGFNFLSLIDKIFGDMSNTSTLTADFLMSRAILTPKNKDVSALNDSILQRFPGDAQEFVSADSRDDPEDQITYPPELLNSLDPSGSPPHSLKLKQGCPIMLLRNLNAAQGLCNGTRLICRSFQRFFIEAKITTGTHVGQVALIPRLTLTPAKTQCPTQFKRTQFPVRMAFSMTINKAQGQTFDTVGLYLPQPVFTHGLLYVAMSRVRTPSSISITMDRENSTLPGRQGHYTRNVVYNEVLI